MKENWSKHEMVFQQSEHDNFNVLKILYHLVKHDDQKALKKIE